MSNGDRLEAPCERAARDIIPAIKAAIAVILNEKYGYNITQIARLLGVTPTSVMNYLNGKRGGAYVKVILLVPELRKSVEEAADIINTLRSRGYPISAASYLLCMLCRKLRYYIEKCPDIVEEALKCERSNAKRGRKSIL